MWKIAPLFFFSFLSAHACKTANQDSSEKLIGGIPVEAGELPFVVRLNSKCTAAKIGPHHFLTAAHCVVEVTGPESSPKTAYKLARNAGLVQIESDGAGTSPAGVLSYTADVVVHPSYIKYERSFRSQPANSRGVEKSFDLAIIVIEDLTPGIPVVRLDSRPLLPDETIILTGFGCESSRSNSESAPLSGRKKRASVKIAEVSGSFLRVGHKDLKNMEVSLCSGDSGGPALRQTSEQFSIVGVNTFRSDSLDGLTRVDTAAQDPETSPASIHSWLEAQLKISVSGKRTKDLPIQRYSCPAQHSKSDPSFAAEPVFTYTLSNLGIRKNGDDLIEFAPNMAIAITRKNNPGGADESQMQIEIPLAFDPRGDGSLNVQGSVVNQALNERHEILLHYDTAYKGLIFSHKYCNSKMPQCEVFGAGSKGGLFVLKDCPTTP